MLSPTGGAAPRWRIGLLGGSRNGVAGLLFVGRQMLSGHGTVVFGENVNSPNTGVYVTWRRFMSWFIDITSSLALLGAVPYPWWLWKRVHHSPAQGCELSTGSHSRWPDEKPSRRSCRENGRRQS